MFTTKPSPGGEPRFVRRDIVGPETGIVISGTRFFRRTVAAHVHRDETVLLCEVRAQLSVPGERALRESVNEEDGRTSRIPSFYGVKPAASPSASSCQ